MDRNTAVKVCAIADEIMSQAGQLLDVVNESCGPDERTLLHKPLARVIGEVDLEILEPIYRTYPDLRPGGLEEIRE